MDGVNDAMHMPPLEDQQITEFKLNRHKLLGDELDPLGLYTTDVPNDGSCQFAALVVGLATLVEHPPSSDQELRNQIADYLLANKESLEVGQQLSFQHGDAAFRKGALSAYGNTYTLSNCIVPSCAIQ